MVLLAPAAFGQARDVQLFHSIEAAEGADGDTFGTALGMTRGQVLVGAPEHDPNKDNDGGAFVFDTVSGAQTHALSASDGDSDELFGSDVAADEVYSLITNLEGEVYCYDSLFWRERYKIGPGRAVAVELSTGLVGDREGESVAVVDLRDGGRTLRQLVPNEGENGAGFGQSVAMENGIAIVGAFGTALLFHVDTGKMLRVLSVPGVGAEERFGFSVDIRDGVALVGAPEFNGLEGRAYVFDTASGELRHTLLGVPDSLFGMAVALGDGVAAVGAPFRPWPDGGGGEVTLFDTADGSVISSLRDPQPGSADYFGYAVAIDGLWLAISAPRHRGRAHVYKFDPPFPGGGIADDPFRIGTPEHLLAMGDYPELWCGHFRIVADIDLAGHERDDAPRIDGFTGVLDGGGHRISHDHNHNRGGLLAGASGALIRDLTLFDSRVSNGGTSGALVNRGSGTTLINCHAVGGRVHGEADTGALAGTALRLLDCSARDVEVYGENWRVGGLVGSAARVERCWSSGDVRGWRFVGGLVGEVTIEPAGSSIAQCYSLATVLAHQGAGGALIGQLGDLSNIVVDCYALGSAQSEQGVVGGLFGSVDGGSMHHCFTAAELGAGGGGGIIGELAAMPIGSTGLIWDIDQTGAEMGIYEIEDSPGVGLIGLTTTEAQSIAPYLAAGFDFEGEVANGLDDVWRMFKGAPDYPHLWWETGDVGNLPDEDGDGLLDAWEIRHFGTTVGVEPGMDTDGDRLDTDLEYVLGLDPNRASPDNELLPAISVSRTPDDADETLTVSFELPSELPLGLVYVLQVAGEQLDWQTLTKRHPDDGEWSGAARASETITADGGRSITLQDVAPIGEGRIRLLRLAIR